MAFLSCGEFASPNASLTIPGSLRAWRMNLVGEDPLSLHTGPSGSSYYSRSPPPPTQERGVPAQLARFEPLIKPWLILLCHQSIKADVHL